MGTEVNEVQVWIDESSAHMFVRVGKGKSVHLFDGAETLCQRGGDGKFTRIAGSEILDYSPCRTCYSRMENKVNAQLAAEVVAPTNFQNEYDALFYTPDGMEYADGIDLDAKAAADANADDTAAEHGYATLTEAWYEVALAAYRRIIDTQPTHVSRLDTDAVQPVQSGAHDDHNEGGSTMAATKLKLKDVRGDVRIGAVPGADAIHALRNVADEHGRNLAMCRTRTKNPIQFWGPAADQKPNLELCAACSKVVPTGEVVVTEVPVKVPGLDLTVTQKVITPVEGDTQGENMPAAKKTAAAPAEDLDAQISRVHEFIDRIKTADTADMADAAAGQAEDQITKLPTKNRNTLRKAVSDAKAARLDELKGAAPAADAPAAAPSTEVATRKPAEVAADFNDFPGVKPLVAEGVKLVKDGIDLGLKLGNAGEKLAHVMLDIRTRIPNPEAGKLPDLLATTKTAKNASTAVYTEALKSIAEDDVDRRNAHTTIQRATQNKASDVLVDWLRSFDGPDREETLTVMRDLFPGAVKMIEARDAAIAEAEADPDVNEADYPTPLTPSEAIRALYAEHSIELPRYGRTELARYDRRVKAIEAAEKDREALVESTEPGAAEELEKLDERVKELKAEVPADVLEEKLAPSAEKSDAEKTADALAKVKAELEKAGKRFAKVTAANQKRKAKAELYNIIRAAADAFDLDLSALVTSDDDE